jgi:hypothetical protein
VDSRSLKDAERGGVKVAVIGQAFPFTPIANPRWMIPKWTFGIRDGDLQKEVDDDVGRIVRVAHDGGSWHMTVVALSAELIRGCVRTGRTR